MNPNLENNDYVVLKKRNLKIQRFDIVVFKKNNKYFIKRVIGLPNEKIEYKGNVLSVDGSIISESYDVGITDDFCLEEKIPKGMYFVLGDNRKYSDDSRMYGYIKHDEIIGVVVFKLF